MVVNNRGLGGCRCRQFGSAGIDCAVNDKDGQQSKQQSEAKLKQSSREPAVKINNTHRARVQGMLHIPLPQSAGFRLSQLDKPSCASADLIKCR